MGLAAAALYIACLQDNTEKESDWYSSRLRYQNKKNQRSIAEAAGVTEVTIRNRYKELKEKLGIEIPIRSEKIRSFLCMRKA